jgi:hypothetical protein
MNPQQWVGNEEIAAAAEFRSHRWTKQSVMQSPEVEGVPAWQNTVRALISNPSPV